MNSGLAFVSILTLIFAVIMTFLTILMVDEMSKEEFRSIRRIIVAAFLLGYLANFLSCIITRGDSAISVAKVAARFKWYGIFGIILLVIGMACIVYLGSTLDYIYFRYILHGFLLVVYYVAAIILAFVLAGFFKQAATDAGAYETEETAYEESTEEIVRHYMEMDHDPDEEDEGHSLIFYTTESIREQTGN